MEVHLHPVSLLNELLRVICSQTISVCKKNILRIYMSYTRLRCEYFTYCYFMDGADKTKNIFICSYTTKRNSLLKK